VRSADRAALIELANTSGVAAKLIGTTGGSHLVLRVGGRTVIDIPIDVAEAVWATAIGRHFKGRAA
jgi:hypothetical protein